MGGTSTPEERARKRTEEWEGMWWHVVVYVIINGFLWGLDWIQGGGIQWAYWITLTWLIGLAFHVAAYNIEERGSDRTYQKFLREELDREAEGRSD